MGCGMSNLRPRSARRPARPSRFPRRWLALPLLLLTFGAAPGAANEAASLRPPPATRPAASPRDPAAQMPRWFAELGHSDPRVREAARVSLMGLPRKDLPKLEKLVRDSVPLVPSQAVVLREIVIHAFLPGGRSNPPGAAGFFGVRRGGPNLNFAGPRLRAPRHHQARAGGQERPGHHTPSSRFMAAVIRWRVLKYAAQGSSSAARRAGSVATVKWSERSFGPSSSQATGTESGPCGLARVE